jgi:DNA-binding NtrC family response regulator
MQIGVESARAVENRRIFVVDQDEIVRAALQFMLHDENETHELASLTAAIEKAVHWPPDVIVLGNAVLADEGLPVLEQLADALPRARLLVVGSDQDPLAIKALAAGAHGRIPLPLKLEAVRAVVDRVLGRDA